MTIPILYRVVIGGCTPDAMQHEAKRSGASLIRGPGCPKALDPGSAAHRIASRMYPTCDNQMSAGSRVYPTSGALRRARGTDRSVGASLFPPEQAGRLDRQQQGHGRVEREVRNLREQRLAEIVGKPDDQRTDRRPGEAAHAADDHHRKGDGQDLEVEPRIDAEERTADHAAERRERGA